MWHEVMQYALAKTPAEAFTRSDNPPTPSKPALRGIWQGNDTHVQNGIEFVTQSVHEILQWVDRSNPTGAPPTDPTQDSQYAYWEYPVHAWAQANGYQDGVQVPVGNAPQI